MQPKIIVNDLVNKETIPLSQLHPQADIISVLSGKSHGSLNKYAKMAKKSMRNGNSAGKPGLQKNMFKDERNKRSTINS